MMVVNRTTIMGVIRGSARCTSVHHLISRCFCLSQQQLNYHHPHHQQHLVSPSSSSQVFALIFRRKSSSLFSPPPNSTKVTAVTAKPQHLLQFRPANFHCTSTAETDQKTTMSQGSENGARIVAKSEMAAFMVRVMTAVGVSEEHAASLADCLVTGDYRGHYSHGLNRLGK